MKTANKYIFLLISSAIIIIALISCASEQGFISGSKSGKYIDVFPLSENATQYFVRPIEWKTKEMSIGIDFTIRTHRNARSNNPVTFCYTLVKETPFQTEPFLSFIIDDTTAITPSMVDSLVSNDNNRYVRYTSHIEYYDFIKMLSAKSIDLIILDGMSDIRVKLPKQFYKASDELKRMLNA